MANLEQLLPLILKWEGGYANDPADLGGATNKGVTIATWRKQGYDKNGDGVIDVEDLKLISDEDVAERILRPHYWNRWQADRIDSQALANILVDWVWGSGRYGITIPQGILGVTADGVVGEKTLGAVNNFPDPESLFEKIKQVRRAYLNMICIDRPANGRFLKGWLNRLNDFKWLPMALLSCILFSCRSTMKTETRNGKQTERTLQATSLHTDRKANEKEDGRLSEIQNDAGATETLTVVFDTLNSKPVLKEISIKRTVSDRNVHREQQTERQSAGTETIVERQKAKGEGQTTLHAESKEKPVKKSIVWRFVGGAIVFLLLMGGWRIIKTIQKSTTI